MFWVKPVSVILSIFIALPVITMGILTIIWTATLDNANRFDQFDIKFPTVALKLALAAGAMAIPIVVFLLGFLHPAATCIQMGYSVVVAILMIVARQLIASWMDQYTSRELYDLLKYTGTNKYGREFRRSYATEFVELSNFLLALFVLILVGLVLALAFLHEDLSILYWDIRYRIEARRLIAERKRRQEQTLAAVQLATTTAATEHRGQENCAEGQSSTAQPAIGRASMDSEQTFAASPPGADACWST